MGGIRPSPSRPSIRRSLTRTCKLRSAINPSGIAPLRNKLGAPSIAFFAMGGIRPSPSRRPSGAKVAPIFPIPGPCSQICSPMAPILIADRSTVQPSHRGQDQRRQRIRRYAAVWRNHPHPRRQSRSFLEQPTEAHYKSEPKASRRPSQSLTTNSRECHGMSAGSRTNSTPRAAYSA